MGWVVNAMPWPLTPGKDPHPSRPAPGPENLASTGIRSPDRRSRSQLLYRLSYPGSQLPLPDVYVITFRQAADALGRLLSGWFKAFLSPLPKSISGPTLGIALSWRCRWGTRCDFGGAHVRHCPTDCDILLRSATTACLFGDKLAFIAHCIMACAITFCENDDAASCNRPELNPDPHKCIVDATSLCMQHC
jgi:hypothetical protein